MKGDVVADFGDIRRMQVLTDKMQRLIQLLRLNKRLGFKLKSGVADIGARSDRTSLATFKSLQLELDKFIFQQETSLDRLEALVARSSGISQLVSSIEPSSSDANVRVDPKYPRC